MTICVRVRPNQLQMSTVVRIDLEIARRPVAFGSGAEVQQHVLYNRQQRLRRRQQQLQANAAGGNVSRGARGDGVRRRSRTAAETSNRAELAENGAGPRHSVHDL